MMDITTGRQWAHKIPQTKSNLKRYGEAVIHHAFNLVLVHSLEENSAVSISNHPLEKARLLARIYEDLAEREADRIGEPTALAGAKL